MASVVDDRAARGRSVDLALLSTEPKATHPELHIFVRRVLALRRAWHKDVEIREHARDTWQWARDAEHPGCWGNDGSLDPEHNPASKRWKLEGQQAGPVTLLLRSVARLGMQLTCSFILVQSDGTHSDLMGMPIQRLRAFCFQLARDALTSR
eukprot:8813370-Alexandrium_andersonii.AAC.1